MKSSMKSSIVRLLIVAVAILLASPVSVSAGLLQWEVGSGGNGHWYELIDDPLTWSNAKVAAEGEELNSVAGHLVTITSEEENTFVYNNIYDNDLYEAAWIGLTDDEAFGGYESFGESNPDVDGWVWVTGEAVTFTSWGPPAPNNVGNADYALMHQYVQVGTTPWNDQVASFATQYIIEYDIVPIPEPSTFVLLCMGIFSFLMYTRQRHKH